MASIVPRADPQGAGAEKPDVQLRAGSPRVLGNDRGVAFSRAVDFARSLPNGIGSPPGTLQERTRCANSSAATGLLNR